MQIQPQVPQIIAYYVLLRLPRQELMNNLVSKLALLRIFYNSIYFFYYYRDDQSKMLRTLSTCAVSTQHIYQVGGKFQIPARLAAPPLTCLVTLPTNIRRRATTQDADTTTSASDNSLLCLVAAATTRINE